ncbi:MAG: glycogen synthase GlgA [Clostridium sp.]|uniref:glycogen synthase GlgA n=1 Tax=Clostridium sp. TaxID=1506 RepID=UPI003F381F2C
MKLLFVATEAYPFIRTGGLGDVIGALSKELAQNKLDDIRVIIPKYKDIKNIYKDSFTHLKHIFVNVGWRHQYCGIDMLKKDNITFYFIDNKYYFDRDGLYGFFDDGERFAFFDRAVLDILNSLNWFPDIVHCNDWQCGMIPVLYKLEYRHKDNYRNIKFIYSIHNILFQGNFDKTMLGELFGYDMEQFNNGMLEFHGGISYMKGGINYSDKVLTVSESYAKEIQTPEYGENLDGLLRSKRFNIRGILNGIDFDEYNPETDPHINLNYSCETLENKIKNKLELQKELSLEVNKDIPFIGLVTRLTSQKGLDLLMESIEDIISQNIQLVILGKGESIYEEFFNNLEIKYPNKVRTKLLFDNNLSHRIYAGIDIFLMPSKFEPCGLGQLIALRYGSIPIVRATGGLKDTVIPYNKYENTGNGFSFKNYSSTEFTNSILYALEIYKNTRLWKNLIKRAMLSDNSFEKAAKIYKELYLSLI